MELGAPIGHGLRSVVFAWGEIDVVKVAQPTTPETWLAHEARLLDAAAAAGARVPGRRRVVDVDGRPALVTERIPGGSMWEQLAAEPAAAAELGRRLVEVQAELAACRASFEFPSQRDRLRSKIHLAARRHGSDLLEAIDLVPDVDGPLVLCHGDLHPHNVLLGPTGPVVIDWFDASRGAIAAEVARTALIIGVSSRLAVPAPPEAVEELRTGYLAAAADRWVIDTDEFERWSLVQYVARLGEGVDGDVADARRRLAERARS